MATRSGTVGETESAVKHESGGEIAESGAWSPAAVRNSPSLYSSEIFITWQ